MTRLALKGSGCGGGVGARTRPPHPDASSDDVAESMQLLDDLWLLRLYPGLVVMCLAEKGGTRAHLVKLHRRAPAGAWAGTPACGKGLRGNRLWLPVAPSLSTKGEVCDPCVRHVGSCAKCRPKLCLPEEAP